MHPNLAAELLPQLEQHAQRTANVNRLQVLAKAHPTDNDVAEQLRKAVGTSDVTALVPEDLEIEAHNLLWDESSPNELTFLKMLPSTPATQIEHKFPLITAYGDDQDFGFFPERGLPPGSSVGSAQRTVNIKMQGMRASTFLLSSLEKTVKALGTSGAQNINRAAVRLNLMRKIERAALFSDTTEVRQGSGGIRYKGIFQLIREGTDGTTGTSPFGSHIIDMEGDALTVANVRTRAAQVISLFGDLSALLMDPFVSADFEGSLDTAQRLNFPISASPLMVGQRVAGIQTGTSNVFFHQDNTLSTAFTKRAYTTNVGEGAPTVLPTVVATAQTDNSSGDTVESKWDSASAGNVFYVITEIVDGVEGLGRRYPSSTGSFTAVTAGQEVKLVITPGNSLADGFRVYRGTDADDRMVAARFCFGVSNSASGAAVTAYDNNLFRPNTSVAFGLPMFGDAVTALQGGYANAKKLSSELLSAKEGARNVVAMAQLGPKMGVLDMARVLATQDHALLYSAGAPIVRNPLQCMVFKNIGPA